MRTKISSIQIVPTEGLPEIERYDKQLKALILSPEAAIPGSRGFGLSREFVSRPPMEARNILAMELEEKCEEYIGEITIADVELDFQLDGSADMTIYAERREIE